MIEASKLNIGKTYYTLGFDIEGNIPQITPYIYTGKEIDADNSEIVKWCFQNPYTYMVYGVLKKTPKEFCSGIIKYDERFFIFIHDLDGLITQLSKFVIERKEDEGFVPGKILFFVQFYDLELTIPMIDTWIYIGQTIDIESFGDDKIRYLFKDTNEVNKALPKNPTFDDSGFSCDEASLNMFYNCSQLISLLMKLKERVS